MKRQLLMIGLSTLALLVSSLSFGGDYGGYNNSPYNYKNSQYNYENSPYNYKNSPYNYNNSPYNTNSNNGVYNENGERTGYGVRRSDGGINYFNNDGERTGYQSGWE